MSSIAQHVPMIRTAALPAAPIWMLLGALLVAAAVLIAPLAEVTAFAGPAHVQAFLSKPGLRTAIANSLTIALACTLITVPIAFVYAYALHRSRMPARHAFRVIAQLPLLCPSLLPAIGLVYLFGVL